MEAKPRLVKSDPSYDRATDAYSPVTLGGQMIALQCHACPLRIARGRLFQGEAGTAGLRKLRRARKMYNAMRQHVAQAHPKLEKPLPHYGTDYGKRPVTNELLCFQCPGAIPFEVSREDVAVVDGIRSAHGLTLFRRQRARILAHFKTTHTEEFS